MRIYEGTPARFVTVLLWDRRIIMLATPKYHIQKDIKAGFLVDPKEVALMGPME